MKLPAVLLCAVLVGALCSCSSTPASVPGASASADPGSALFLDRARPLLPGLPDGRLTQLAGMVCDQLSVNVDGDDTTEIDVQRSAPTRVSTSAANDFMQAAVLWHCPTSYEPGDFVHPHKYGT